MLNPSYWSDSMKPIICAAGHSGASPKVASPESIALGRRFMDSGLAG